MYYTLKNLDINIRMSIDHVLYDEFGHEIQRQELLPYSQVSMDLSDVEDMLENIGAVADNVKLYIKKVSNHDIVTLDQYSGSRKVIQNALSTLIKNLTNQAFHDSYIKQISSDVSRFEYFEATATEEMKVYIMFKHNIFSSELVLPERPGAIINNYEVITNE